MSMTLALYDHILTFPEEVKYIWKARMKVTDYLYLLSRYGTQAYLVFSLIYTLKTQDDKV